MNRHYLIIGGLAGLAFVSSLFSWFYPKTFSRQFVAEQKLVSASAPARLLLPDNYQTDGKPTTTGNLTAKMLGNKEDLTMIFVGDIMLSRGIGRIMAKRDDWSYHFRRVVDELSQADVTIGNLEGPISARGKDGGNLYSFRADPRSVAGLTLAGVDVLSLANNHLWDWGLTALEETLDLLSVAGIKTVGAGKNYHQANQAQIIDLKGNKIAFLAYTNLMPVTLQAKQTRGGLSSPEVAVIKEQLAELKPQVDLIVLLWHWGEEYETRSRSVEQQLARQLIEAGADLIVGHHPHVVQETENYQGGLIAYSLGNFIFDQNFSADTAWGQALKVYLHQGKISRFETKNVRFTKDFQPVWEEAS